MKPTELNIEVANIDDFPNLKEIQEIQRGLQLRINLVGSAQKHQKEKGEELKAVLPNFFVGIHMNGYEINVRKLITDEEIAQHQDFFELCAKEYGLLGEKLINEFILENNIPDHGGFPLKKLNGYFGNKNHQPRGQMGAWDYYFHGFHCAFENRGTQQKIEVPLTYGEEFGELDPYFFSIFIKSTPEFQPLPVPIYDDSNDGYRILKKMHQLGRFEIINSNLTGRSGYIVKDRIKKEVQQLENGIASVMEETVFRGKRPAKKRWFKK